MNNISLRESKQEFSFVASNFDEAMKIAKMVSESSFCPKQFQGKAGDVLIAIQMGQEVGLKPLQAIQSISVINGRPSTWGDGFWGIILSQPDLEDTKEYIEGEGDDRTAYCVIKKKGKNPVIGKFSIADAKRAKLTGKEGSWQGYPDRMLQMRARGFAGRDAYAHALRGIIIAEEAMDMPQEKIVNSVVDFDKLLDSKKQIPQQALTSKNSEPDIVDTQFIPKETVINIINNSKTLDELKEVNELSQKVTAEDKKEIKKVYLERKKQLQASQEVQGTVEECDASKEFFAGT